MQIRESFLPLLQTKLGFFSEKQYSGTKLRYILGAFPTLVKNKGSMYAVKGAINAYIKAIGIEPNIIIWYTKTAISQNGINIPDHSLIIGIEGQLEDLAILYDVFRYIIPTGIGYYFYFYETMTAEDKLVLNDYANLVFVSDAINGRIRNITEHYILLSTKPSDWDNNKTRYFKKPGETYVPVVASDTWATNTYYTGDANRLVGDADTMVIISEPPTTKTAPDPEVKTIS